MVSRNFKRDWILQDTSTLSQGKAFLLWSGLQKAILKLCYHLHWIILFCITYEFKWVQPPVTLVAFSKVTVNLLWVLFFSKQNENGIQAQEMWQLSQYLQVCDCLCYVHVSGQKCNLSNQSSYFCRMRYIENKCSKTSWQTFKDFYQTHKQPWKITHR